MAIEITNNSPYAVTVAITHERDGCLEQGGVCGRVVRVNKHNVGMPRKAALSDTINEHGATWAHVLIEYVRSRNWYGDQTIHNGHIIR